VQYIQYILHGLTSALLCVPLTTKSVNSVVAHDGFLFIAEKFLYFYTGYFNYTVAFLDPYWVVTGLMQLAMKRNGFSDDK